MGDVCTRTCGFCSVAAGPPGARPDRTGPRRRSRERMGLKYVVITAVNRDDLPDGGAGHFAGDDPGNPHRVPERGSRC